MACQTRSWSSVGLKFVGISLVWLGGWSIGISALADVHFPSKLKLQSQAVVASPPKPAGLTNTSIVPGVNFGPVTAKTAYQDLLKQFGANRLVDVRPPDAKDTEREFGTRVNLGPDWSMLVVWQDKTKTKPFEIIEMGPAWQLPGGLRIGMPMNEVMKRLGNFDMVGLGGPYGGVIPLRGTSIQQHFGKMIVQMAPVENADKKFPQAYKALEGERLIPSKDPNWQALGMTIKYVIFPFPRQP